MCLKRISFKHVLQIKIRVLLNRAPISIQLHPTPPSFIHLHPAHFNLHPAHLSLHPPLCNTLNVIITKTSHLIGQFPQIYTENSKLSVLSENWLSWHIGGADSESRIRTSKFRPQNPFLGKFGPKIQSCPFCLKIGTHGILKVLIRNLGIEFQNSDPKILFWANLGCKFKVVSFA